MSVSLILPLEKVGIIHGFFLLETKNDEILSIVSTKPGKQKVLRRFLVIGRWGEEDRWKPRV